MTDFADYLDAYRPAPIRAGFAALGVEPSTGVAWNDWMNQPAHGDATSLLATVDAVERATTAVRLELQRRTAGATIAFNGEYRIQQMPAGPSGSCPVLGALDYVYPDLFAAAQTNLKQLSDNNPRRGAPGALVRRWVTLIRWNIHLLYHASNLRHRFLFPTDTDPSNTDPNFDFRGTDNRTKRTNVGVGSQGADVFGYKNGAPIGGAEVLGELYGGPQAVTDLLNRVIGRYGDPTIAGGYGPHARYLTAGTLRPEIKLDRSYTTANGVYARPDGALMTSSVNAPALRQRNAEGAQFDSDLATTWSTGTRFYQRSATDAALPYDAPLVYIEVWREMARIYSEVSLDTLLLEALGFYVFNHNVYWMSALGLTPDQVAESQRAASQASLRSHPATATISIATTAVLTAINPIIAVIYGILQAVGMELLRPFLLNNIEYAAPYSLFVRVPHPGCVQLTPEATAAEMARRVAANRTDSAGLPVELPAHAGPIMLTPTQRAALFERQRTGNLTSSQQALLVRQGPLLYEPPPAAAKSSLVPIGIGAALLALFFSRR